MPGVVAGRAVFLTTDNKLYRHTGSGWIATVAATDITGLVTAAQITALAVTADKIPEPISMKRSKTQRTWAASAGFCTSFRLFTS